MVISAHAATSATAATGHGTQVNIAVAGSKYDCPRPLITSSQQANQPIPLKDSIDQTNRILLRYRQRRHSQRVDNRANQWQDRQLIWDIECGLFGHSIVVSSQ